MSEERQLIRVQMKVKGRECDLLLQVHSSPVRFTEEELEEAADAAATVLEETCEWK